MSKEKFDAKKEVNHIVDDIRHYFTHNGNSNTKAIIGMSGGKDSTIAAALLVRALGPDRVIGVRMPNGLSHEDDIAAQVCDMLGIQHIYIDISKQLYEFTDALAFHYGDLNSQVMTNAPARIRMNILYGVAATVGGRVINTGNASELYIGYTTKYGDLAGDYAILRDYYVTEVYQIGDALSEIPSELVHKVPSDGMCGKTDEDNLGFTYEVLDAYLIDGVTPDIKTLQNITERHDRNMHKINAIHLPHPRALTRPYRYRHGGVYEDLSF